MKQKEQLAAQEQKLEELTLKIEDVETLLDDVSDAAYDKAVEVVTDTVRQETHKEDIRLVEETKKWVLSPERKAPKKEREYAAARLDGVINKIKNVMQTALAKIQRTPSRPGRSRSRRKPKNPLWICWQRQRSTQTGITGSVGNGRGGLPLQRNRIWSCKVSDFLRKPGAFFSVWR